MKAGWRAIACLAWALFTPATASALTIVATYDTSITNHPQAATIIATINAAIAQYPPRIIDPITVNITFQRIYTGLGSSTTQNHTRLYSDYLTALRDHAASADDAYALSHLPDGSGNPVTGDASLYVQDALLRALGLGASPQEPGTIAFHVLSGPRDDPLTRRPDPETLRRQRLAAEALMAQPASPQAPPDGVINLNLTSMNLTTNPTPVGKFSLFAVASHEIDEVLASASALNGLSNGAPAPTGPVFEEDMFRYNRFGNRSFHTSATDSSYLSFDGSTRLVRFNQTAGGDFSDWWSPSPGAPTPRVQDAFQTSGVDPTMDVEWRMLDALGYNGGPKGVWVDFAYGGAQTGAYATPYSTLAQGIAAVPVGGTIFIKGFHNSGELPTITKAMTLATVGGPVVIGP